MVSSEGSSVVNSRLSIRPIENNEELIEASMDLLRAHVRLIMAGILTMEESKPVLRSAFSALRRFHGDGWLVHTGKRIEALVKQRERMTSTSLAAEAARRITQEKLAGLRPGWSEERWRAREARLL